MRLLYVEDNPIALDLVCYQLAQHAPHIRVTTVNSLAKARDHLKRNGGIDLILLDLDLPDGNGLELPKEVRTRGLPLAVVILTGNGNESMVLNALKAGADDYVIKRDHLSQLPAILDQALTSSRSDLHHQSRPLRVIYAEHHLADIDLTQRHLSAKAHHIFMDVVESIDELLQRLPQGPDAPCPWSVLLMDYRMPGINALEALKIIRQKRNLDIRVVLATGQGSEERFRELFLNMQEGAAILKAVDNGEDFILQQINPSGATVAQVDPDAVWGQRVQKLFSGLEAAGLVNAFKTAWQSDHPQRIPLTFYQDHRLQMWTENFTFRLSSDDIVNIFRDLTRSKQAEEDLLQSEQMLRSILNASPNGVYAKNDAGIYLLVNTTLADLYGLSPEDVIGTTDSQLLANKGLDHDGLRRMIKDDEAVISARKQATFDKIHYTLRDGSVCWFRLVKMPVALPGRPRCVLSIALDITDQVRAEEQQSLLFTAIEQRPATIIITNRDGTIKYVNPAFESITGYSRREAIGANPRILKSGKHDAVFYDNMWLPLKRGKTRHGHIVNRKSDVNSNGYVLADPTQIHQIFMNLATNAAHAMEESGGRLEIGLHNITLPSPGLMLSVSDTGSGIAPEIMAFIFDPYFTTKNVGEGTGLGLAAVHGIVKGCGGDITVDNRLGKGATFTVYLPQVEGSDDEGAQAVEPQIPPGTEHILIIDDEPSVGSHAGKNAPETGISGYQTDSRKALSLFKDHPNRFDMVITDMAMPELSGDRLAAKMLAIRSFCAPGTAKNSARKQSIAWVSGLWS